MKTNHTIKWFLTVVSVFLIMSIGLIGCQTEQGKNSVTSPIEPSKVKFPLVLEDQAGNKLKFDKPAERIVSLIPSNTEIAYALHLDKNMVGGTANDDYPAAAKSLPKVGDMTINAEKVVTQKPDLVLASPLNGKETIDKLKSLGLTVMVLDGQDIKGVYKSISLVGAATNRLHEADTLIGGMEKEKLAIYQQVAPIASKSPKKVWIEIDPTLYTAGDQTLLNEMLKVAGGTNVAAIQKGWPQITSEQVVKWNPDVIFSTYGSTKEITTRPAWANINAIKNKQVFTIDPNLTSRPGPRIIDGIRAMAELLYPEQMKKK